MEIALHPEMPTYSGGLGMLAGDTIRAAADLCVSMVAVTLLHRKGYFAQSLDASGWQHETAVPWDIEHYCTEVPERVEVCIEGRSVQIRAWQYQVTGLAGNVMPVFLLDTDVESNSEWDRTLTDTLYGGDGRYRLCQEAVLGIGGVRMLRQLGYNNLSRFHMNEGHAALLGLELLDERAKPGGRSTFNSDDIQAVRRTCVFTTHTPVPAGHDRFPLEQVKRTLGRSDLFLNHEVFCCEGELNLTYLALNLSHYVNGVARKHGEVSRQMLVPKDANHHYAIDHITNGVDPKTWAAPPFAELFNRHLPGWHEDNASLRSALSIPANEIWQAHRTAKQTLIDEINSRTSPAFDTETLTIGFARRATAYKRADLLLHDTDRLKELARQAGALQVVFSGKAHPHDEQGKQLIQQIIRLKDTILPEIRIVYIANYNWELARLLVAGVDVWLNTPQPPLEASGTSGMKAALNGVPSLSVLDGWWIEGCVPDITGWSIGDRDTVETRGQDRTLRDADSLYDTLQNNIIPKYYNDRNSWLGIMSHSIALNASYFNTQRMVQQYVLKAYFE